MQIRLLILNVGQLGTNVSLHLYGTKLCNLGKLAVEVWVIS